MPGARQSGFRVDRKAGILDYDYRIDSGEIQNVVVDYVGGYRTTPEGLKNVALRYATYMYNQTLRDPSMKSEKLGDYSYTASEGSIKDSDGSIVPGSELGAALGPWVRTIAR